LLVLPLLVCLDPRGSVVQVRGEHGFRAVDQEEWSETRGPAWGVPEASDK
jgi:hypothetical protein